MYATGEYEMFREAPCVWLIFQTGGMSIDGTTYEIVSIYFSLSLANTFGVKKEALETIE